MGKTLQTIPEVRWEDLSETDKNALLITGTVVGSFVVFKAGAIVYRASVTAAPIVINKFSSKIAEYATKNPTAQEVILGKFNQASPELSYEAVAASRGATYFYMDSSKWQALYKVLGKNGMWKINEQFLIQQIQQGKTFTFLQNPNVATGTFADEVQYLSKVGYTFIQQGDIWKAIK